MPTKYVFKTPPYKHQVRALKKLFSGKAAPGGGLFMPMRSGKTKTAIDFCGICRLKYPDFNRVLIICPLSVIGVWRQQFKKHYPFPYLFNDTDEVITEHDGLIVECINFERVYDRQSFKSGKTRGWHVIDQEWLKQYNPDCIIVDESHKIGDPTTAVSKKLCKLARDSGVKYRLILTGTAIHRKPFYLFGQFKFLDDSVFGTAWGNMKKEYGLWGGYGNHTLVKYINLKRLRKKINPYVFNMAHVPVRPPVDSVIPVELDSKALEVYNEMANEGVVEIESGVATGDLIITRLMKLAQIAEGWLRDEDGTWHRVGDHHQRAFREKLEELESSDMQKVVIGCRFIPGLKDAAKICKEVGYRPILLHGGVPENTRQSRIADFDECNDRVAFISQVSAGALGIDLSAADTLMHYSLAQSLIDFDQFNARIRKFRDDRPLTYYYFLGRGTVHEVQYTSLKKGLDMVKEIMEHPDLLHYRELG